MIGIGCISIVKCLNESAHLGVPHFIGVNCAKKRGVIFPGGKWNPGETFHFAAERELFEETGLTTVRQKFLHSFMSPDGFYVYAFQVDAKGTIKNSSEGLVGVYPWDDFFKSDFGPCYRVLKEIYERRN